MIWQHPAGKMMFFSVGLLAALLCSALAFLPGVSQAEISVSATLSSASFDVDDGAQLSIRVSGTTSAEVNLPETDRDSYEIFQCNQKIEAWSQISLTNRKHNQSSSSVTFDCTIKAYKPGKYTIPPITVSADGATRTTEEIPFEVTASSQSGSGSGTAAAPPSSGSPEGEGQRVFIRLIGGREQSYVGEIIPVAVKAYFHQGLRANLSSAPSLAGDGLVMSQPHSQPVQTREMAGNTPYSVLTWQTALSNIKEGKHTVHLELNATLLIPQRRMSTSVFGQRSPFDDDLFDSVFGGYKEKPITAVSDDLVFEILPLPEAGKPRDFTGAIGNFSFRTGATPQKAEIGEPLTLTMTIRGNGNFDRVEAPAFPDSADWKTYSPSGAFSPEGGSNSAGVKVFEQAIVAKNSTIKQIRSLTFSYFDPQQGRYVTRQSAPVPVTIISEAAATPATAGSTAPTPAAQQTQQQQPPPQPAQPAGSIAGLAPLRLEAGGTEAAIEPLYRNPLFLAVMALCGVTLLILAGRKVYTMREDSRPEERRRRQLIKTLEASCVAVEKALAEDNSTAFLAACRTAIQQHLGAIWQCSPTAITRADLAARIPEAGQLLEVLTIAEQAAYSGCPLNRETMNRYASTLKAELEKLL